MLRRSLRCFVGIIEFLLRQRLILCLRWVEIGSSPVIFGINKGFNLRQDGMVMVRD